MPANPTTAVPTERKNAGRGKERSDPGLTHNLQNAARHDGAKELGKWPVVKSGELLSFVTSGSRGWARYYAESGALFLRIGNLDHDSVSLDLHDLQRVAPPAGAEGTRTKVQASDILISITADVGMVGLVPSTLGEAYINQHVALARPLPTVHPPYLAWCLTSPQAQRQFLKLQRGATKVGLGLDDIRAVDVPPPLSQNSSGL
jgi:type I restriction enzyme, S subunit